MVLDISIINTSHNLIGFIKNKGSFVAIKNLIPIYINALLSQLNTKIEYIIHDLDHLLSIFRDDLIALLSVDGC